MNPISPDDIFTILVELAYIMPYSMHPSRGYCIDILFKVYTEVETEGKLKKKGNNKIISMPLSKM